MTQPSLFEQSTIITCQPQPDLDPCFNRHGGVDTSVAAHRRINKNKDRATVKGYIRAAGVYGYTVDEVSILLDRAPNRISGRFTELATAREIVRTERTRPTRTGSLAHVYVVAE